MNETVLISMPVKELQTLIIDCVNVCLENNNQTKDNVDSDNLLTIKQAAEFITLSVPTIYGLVQRSEIPVSKRGKRLYFSKQELTDWIKAGRKKTNDEISKDAGKRVSQFRNKKG